MIIAIAAVDRNNALGKDNKMMWHLPDDFKRFKQLTTGHCIIMGRKTFESLPKLLPHRTHIVITRQKHYQKPGILSVQSLDEALHCIPSEEDAFIIGGGEIYQLALSHTDKIELTRVESSFEADTFFPKINRDEWEIIYEEFHPKDKHHHFDFSFQTYTRKIKK